MVKFSIVVSLGPSFIIQNQISNYSNLQHAMAVVIGPCFAKRQSEWSCSSSRTRAWAEMTITELKAMERKQYVSPHRGTTPCSACSQSLANVPSEIGAQGEAHWQTAVAMDVSYLAGDAYLPGHVDPECTANSRADPWPGGPPLQAVLLQLVGPQPGHWWVHLPSSVCIGLSLGNCFFSNSTCFHDNMIKTNNAIKVSFKCEFSLHTHFRAASSLNVAPFCYDKFLLLPKLQTNKLSQNFITSIQPKKAECFSFF